MWVVGIVLFVIVMVVWLGFLMQYSLSDKSKNSRSSQFIVNYFEPDNTAPKISELVHYHKTLSDNKKYRIKGYEFENEKRTD